MVQRRDPRAKDEWFIPFRTGDARKKDGECEDEAIRSCMVGATVSLGMSGGHVFGNFTSGQRYAGKVAEGERWL